MSRVERHFIAKLPQPAESVLKSGAIRLLLAGGEAPCITILLCTYNGEKFLAAQLASIEQQTHQNWRLIVSDDHSTDATLAIVQQFAERHPNSIEVREGPRRGSCANFLSLAADPSIGGDYFAFCDQDDVWHPDKLSRALEWMRTAPQGVTAVYGGRTRLICASGKPLGYSRRFSKPPSFANSLVQSIAGGNTMLFNGATKRLFEKAGLLNVVSHDWWAYQLVTGSGGVVHYDSEPHLDYRQHAENFIGTNRGLRAQCKRLRMVLKGGFKVWNDRNLAVLQQSQHLLTEEARALVDTYEVMRTESLGARLQAFVKSPMRRQTLLGDFALLMAILLKKI